MRRNISNGSDCPGRWRACRVLRQFVVGAAFTDVEPQARLAVLRVVAVTAGSSSATGSAGRPSCSRSCRGSAQRPKRRPASSVARSAGRRRGAIQPKLQTPQRWRGSNHEPCASEHLSPDHIDDERRRLIIYRQELFVGGLTLDTSRSTTSWRPRSLPSVRLRDNCSRHAQNAPGFFQKNFETAKFARRDWPNRGFRR